MPFLHRIFANDLLSCSVFCCASFSIYIFVSAYIVFPPNPVAIWSSTFRRLTCNKVAMLLLRKENELLTIRRGMMAASNVMKGRAKKERRRKTGRGMRELHLRWGMGGRRSRPATSVLAEAADEVQPLVRRQGPGVDIRALRLGQGRPRLGLGLH